MTAFSRAKRIPFGRDRAAFLRWMVKIGGHVSLGVIRCGHAKTT